MHIAQALQSRSKAIQNALIRYNAAALQMTPARPVLDWADVVAFGFVSEFDLLRDSRIDIQEKPWATTTGRQALDMFFKIQRAEEELTRCRVEIKRLLTFMRDEEAYLKAAYNAHKDSDPDIAHQIQRKYWFAREMHNDHRKRIEKIQRLRGFGTRIVAGRRLATGASSPRLRRGGLHPPAAHICRR